MMWDTKTEKMNRIERCTMYLILIVLFFGTSNMKPKYEDYLLSDLQFDAQNQLHEDESYVSRKLLQADSQDPFQLYQKIDETSKTAKNHSDLLQQAKASVEELQKQLEEQQKQYNQQQQELEKEEKTITDLQNQLYELTKFNITVDFTSEEQILSPRVISEEEFGEILETGEVKDVLLVLESGGYTKDYRITKTTKFQRFYLTHLKPTALKFLKLDFWHKDMNLTIEDSEIQFVGLRIVGAGEGVKMSIKNFSAKNTHDTGLWLHYCDPCEINDIEVLNSGADGISFSQSMQCNIDNAFVQGSGRNGVWSQCTKATLKNSISQNNRHHGVLVESGQMTAKNVTLKGNTIAPTKGNYITQ